MIYAPLATSMAISPCFLEDLVVGTMFESHPAAVTSEDISAACRLFGDVNPIHQNESEAQAAGFETIPAPGMLIAGLASGLASQIGGLSASRPVYREILNWRFMKPAYAGCIIQVSLRILEIKPLKSLGSGKVTMEMLVVDQHEAQLAKGVWTLLVQKRPKTAQA